MRNKLRHKQKTVFLNGLYLPVNFSRHFSKVLLLSPVTCRIEPNNPRALPSVSRLIGTDKSRNGSNVCDLQYTKSDDGYTEFSKLVTYSDK